jgi:hypothetical protein
LEALADTPTAEAAGVDPVLLAGAIKTVFTEFSTMQNKDGSPSIVNNYYNGPVTVNNYTSKASGTTHRASAKEARHSKGHASVKGHCVSNVPKVNQPSKPVPGEQLNFCLIDLRSYANIVSYTKRGDQQLGRMLSGCCVRSTDARCLARLVLTGESGQQVRYLRSPLIQKTSSIYNHIPITDVHNSIINL